MIKIKKIYNVIILLEITAIILSVVVPIERLYSNGIIRGYEYPYIHYENIVNYDNIFYDPPKMEYELYTLGFTSQEEAHILNGQTVFKNLRTFDEDAVVKFNNLLKRCNFRPVDRLKASILSIFVSDFTNVAYTKMREDYIKPEMQESIVENDSFKPDVLKYVVDKDSGVSMASINRIFGKTYMFALFNSGHETVTLSNGEQYTVPEREKQKISVFEVVSDEAGKELASERKNFRFYSRKGFLLSLSFYNPLNYKVVLILLGTLLVTVSLFCIRRKKV